MSVTLKQIAAVTGMSKATVSRALRNDRVIHPDTRSRVLVAAARAGYERPTRKSPRPAKKQLRLLLLLPPHSRAGYTVVHDYLRGMMRGVAEVDGFLSVEEVSEEGVGKLAEPNWLPREIVSGGVDGVVLGGWHNHQDVAALARMLPVVSIQWEHTAPHIDLVSGANYHGTVTLVRHLVQCGHRHLGWVGASYQASFFTERKMGFLQGCMENGIEVDQRSIMDNYQAAGVKETLGMLVQQGVTALVCANDFVARTIAEWTLAAGLKVPEDLSVTGYDAVPEPIQNGKTLTSYDPIFLEVGRTAIHAVLRRIKDPGMPRITYLCEGRMKCGETVAKLCEC